MARKHKHEDHINHEAWAIPYGDLITLLLAFFVVMYSMSSVNEGKYRVLADSLAAAFGGAPKSMQPVQMGKTATKSEVQPSPVTSPLPSRGAPSSGESQLPKPGHLVPAIQTGIPHARDQQGAAAAAATARAQADLGRMAKEVEAALGDLVSRDLITLRKTESWLAIEIKTDILFSSGMATVSDNAQPVLARLAEILKPFPNTLRVEGHTDNQPIRTAAFPSNWELSAARAASVVHLFMQQGVNPQRMRVVGFGEFEPADSNDSLEGRNRNRRVVLVVLATAEAPMPVLPPLPSGKPPAQKAEAPLPQQADLPAAALAVAHGAPS